MPLNRECFLIPHTGVGVPHGSRRQNYQITHMVLRTRLTLIEELLGTKPCDPAIFLTYVGSLKDEATALEEMKVAKDTAARAAALKEEAEQAEQSGTTIFHRNADGKVIIWDYQVKGFFKDACGSLQRMDDWDGGPPLSVKVKPYRKLIDGVIFCAPRQIILKLPSGTAPGYCERPMRVQTPQGERVCLARSETVPAGTIIDVDIRIMKTEMEPVVREWLDYGALRGLGQWRNSGKGAFTWAERT